MSISEIVAMQRRIDQLGDLICQLENKVAEAQTRIAALVARLEKQKATTTRKEASE
jgi:uncharacterized coiled-coil DUF342 family protein